MSEIPQQIGKMLYSRPWTHSIAGATGALAGWAMVEPFFSEGGAVGEWGMANAFFFPAVLGMITAALVFRDSHSRLRLSQALTLAVGGIGLAFGLGFLLLGPCHILFAWTRLGSWSIVYDRASGAFALTMMARSLAWGAMSVAVGLAAGAVTGNWRTFWGAVMGGLLGGLIAGLVFDPLQMWIRLPGGGSAWFSRLTGFVLVGGMAGFVAGVAAETNAEGRLLMLSGSRAGEQFALGAGPSLIGSSKDCDVVLDGGTEANLVYAVIQQVGFGFEIDAVVGHTELLVNDCPMTRARLTHGDRIRIGRTKLAFFSS